MGRLGHFKSGVLGLLISLAALGFIAIQINIERFAAALLDADYRFVLPGAAFVLLGLGSRALRWRVLLAHQLPLRRTFNIMNIAYLVNGILPLRLGEAARIYLVGESVPAMRTASTIVAERLLDALAVVIMAALTLTVTAASTALQAAALLGAALAAGGFAALLLLAYRRRAAEAFIGRLAARVIMFRRLRIDKLAGDFFDGLMPMLGWHSLLLVILWTAVSWILSAVANYMLMFAFFEQGDWGASILTIAMASFAIALPAVPANIGTYEASILAALAALGYEQTNAAIAFAVAVHVINILISAAAGALGLAQEGLSLSRLRAGLRQMQHNLAS